MARVWENKWLPGDYFNAKAPTEMWALFLFNRFDRKYSDRLVADRQLAAMVLLELNIDNNAVMVRGHDSVPVVGSLPENTG